MTDPHFPPLGPLRRILGDGLVVLDANGQSLAYVMSRVNDSDFQCLFTLRNHSTNSCGVRGPSFRLR
jgi:hypothetical protein